MRAKPEKWIEDAIKRPGALRNWFKLRRKELKRKLGYDPFTPKGTIKNKAIRDTMKLIERGKLRVKEITVQRLRLAKTLSKVRRNR